MGPPASGLALRDLLPLRTGDTCQKDKLIPSLLPPQLPGAPLALGVKAGALTVTPKPVMNSPPHPTPPAQYTQPVQLGANRQAERCSLGLRQLSLSTQAGRACVVGESPALLEPLRPQANQSRVPSAGSDTGCGDQRLAAKTRLSATL